MQGLTTTLPCGIRCQKLIGEVAPFYYHRN